MLEAFEDYNDDNPNKYARTVGIGKLSTIYDRTNTKRVNCEVAAVAAYTSWIPHCRPKNGSGSIRIHYIWYYVVHYLVTRQGPK